MYVEFFFMAYSRILGPIIRPKEKNSAWKSALSPVYRVSFEGKWIRKWCSPIFFLVTQKKIHFLFAQNCYPLEKKKVIITPRKSLQQELMIFRTRCCSCVFFLSLIRARLKRMKSLNSCKGSAVLSIIIYALGIIKRRVFSFFFRSKLRTLLYASNWNACGFYCLIIIIIINNSRERDDITIFIRNVLCIRARIFILRKRFLHFCR